MKVQHFRAGMIGAGLLIGTGILCFGRRENAVRAEVSSAQTPALFSSLKSDESAILDYKTRGCFHSRHYRFEYSPLPTPRVTVTDLSERYERIPGTNRSRPVSSPQHLGTVTLTPAQVKRFDNLLRFYRTNRGGRCTTHDSIIFATYHNKQKQSLEDFDDRSCATDDLADADARDLKTTGRKEAPTLSIYGLLSVAAQSAKRKTPLPYRDTPRNKTGAYQAAQWKR